MNDVTPLKSYRKEEDTTLMPEGSTENLKGTDQG